MEESTVAYRIGSTPTVIVDNKYQVKFGNSWNAGMKTTDKLMEKVRGEGKTRAEDGKSAPKSKGASFARFVNH